MSTDNGLQSAPDERIVMRPSGYLTDDQLREFQHDAANHEGNCARCKWWKEHEPPNWSEPENALYVHYEGDCRRRSPVVLPDDDLDQPAHAWWPETKWDDFCGEFEDRGNSIVDA